MEQDLDFDRDAYDLIYSYNTFEHLEDPAVAIGKMLRWCRPGGTIYLEFGPLYASAWGLHAYRSLNMPYPQFLFSEDFVKTQLRAIGIHDLGKERDELQPLNRWRLKDFRKAFELDGSRIVHWEPVEVLGHLSVIKRYPQSFRGRGLKFEDVSTALLKVAIEKSNDEKSFGK